MNEIIPELHPCKYCNKICRGKQCKDCHNKMFSKLQECIDCKITFTPSRCFGCQQVYNKNNLKCCPECGNFYASVSKDGKVFDKCYSCYQNAFSNCKRCNKRCYKQYQYCKACYDIESVDYELKKCKTKSCENKTNYVFCKECYESFKIVNNIH